MMTKNRKGTWQMTVKLLKNQKKELMNKITPEIGIMISRWNEIERWTDLEISYHTGVSGNRLSEFKNFQKYGQPISEVALRKLVQGGIVSLKELIRKVRGQLSMEEIKFLEQFDLLEDQLFAVQMARLRNLQRKNPKVKSVGEIVRAYVDRFEKKS